MKWLQADYGGSLLRSSDLFSEVPVCLQQIFATGNWESAESTSLGMYTIRAEDLIQNRRVRLEMLKLVCRDLNVLALPLPIRFDVFLERLLYINPI